MAGTSSLRSPSATPIAEDDPFAELTRIIGFDPRVKVQPASDPEPDFQIDLERELMGDFGEPEEARDNSDVHAQEAQFPRDFTPQSEVAEPGVEDHADTTAPADEPVPGLDEADLPTAAFVSVEPTGHAALDAERAPDLNSPYDLPAEVDDAPAAVAAEHHDAVVSAEDTRVADVPAVDEAAFGAALTEDKAFSAPEGEAEFSPAATADPAVQAAEPTTEEPTAAESTTSEPSSTFYDDELERAFAALEAWERGSESRVKGPQPQRDEPLFSLPSGSAKMPSAPAAEQDAAPDHQPSEPDFAPRDQFTAEEGWTDEGAVSLNEPQVLHTGAEFSDAPSEDLAPHDDRADPVSQAEPEQAERFDDEFEQQLFELLGADEAEAAESTRAFDDDTWADDVALNEAVLAADADDAPTDEAASFDAGDGSADPHQAQDFFDVEVQHQSAFGAPEHEREVLPFASAGLSHPAEAGTAELADETSPEPAGVSDDPFLAELDRFEMSLNDLMADEAFGQHEPEEGQAPSPDDHDAPHVSAVAQPDPAEISSATPSLEPEPMQPFNERAFDAALAEELGYDDAQGSDWNGGRSVGNYAAAPVAAAYASQAPQRRAHVHAPAMHADVPDIETVDFVDQRVAPSDELDLPEVDYGREDRPVAAFDDFDAEFTSAFNALREEPVAAKPAEEPKRAAASNSWDDGFDFHMAPAAAAAVGGASASSLSRAGLYEPEEEEAHVANPAMRESRSARPVQRRGVMLGGAVALLALLGGVAYFVLPSSDLGNGEPAIVRADADPLKVRPENPGGIVVPNQENAVYERVGSGQIAVPTQERLINSVEEPVDLTINQPEDTDAAPLDGLAALEGEDASGDFGEDSTGTVKAEDRILPEDTVDASSPIPEEMIAVAPRRVRTMVVRPDGTLVPREEAAPAPAPLEVASAAEAAVSAEPLAAQPVAAPALPEPAPAEEPVAAEPASAPEPAPQVAAVEPQPAPSATPEPVTTASPPSGWSVQIASQPSEASARASYEDLARRYASVLEGRPVNIVKADIAGKGTYYRVRIQASSRSEANTICSSYKSAGGNCFVSQ
ncbi:MAG TPA: SPOR domain-containing protein [Tianweitania sediminis]|nr:SPOR domain-containing protein [Tianweitania sediminis]